MPDEIQITQSILLLCLQVNRNYTNKTKSLCKSAIDNLFQSCIISFLYYFCEQVESGAEEEDSMQKLLACINTMAKNDCINQQLILKTRIYLLGSFYPSLDRLCFRHYMHLGMGFIDNNCFTESENSALSRDTSGPKSNHKLHVAGDAIMMHTKKR